MRREKEVSSLLRLLTKNEKNAHIRYYVLCTYIGKTHQLDNYALDVKSKRVDKTSNNIIFICCICVHRERDALQEN